MVSWFGSMLGFTNPSKTAAKLARDISKGIDMLCTNEDKEIAQKCAFTAWLKMVASVNNSELLVNKPRRILVSGIVFTLLAMIWICVFAEVIAVFHWFDVLVIPAGQSVTSITSAILKVASTYQLGWVFCTIIILYFSPHLIQFFRKNGGKK